MDRIPTNEKTSRHPAFYAGRFFDRVDLPGEHDLLSDWDVLAASLDTALAHTSPLVILDLFSFPFESMRRHSLDEVPLILVLPQGFDAEFLTAVFGAPAFERLGFFDRIATADDALWGKLRRRYGWAEGQRLVIGDGCPEEVAAELRALLEAESAPSDFFEEEKRYRTARYWSERGDALANLSPHRAICSVHHDWRSNKAIHLAQAKILEPQFDAARGNRDEGVPFEVLEVGTGIGRWASSFDLARTRFVGVDISEGMIEAARANYPEGRFDRLEEDLILPYDDESFDLAFSVTVMHHNPTPDKRTVLGEMWRVTRPGGRLMFLEDFAIGSQSEQSTVYPMSVVGFAELLLEATAGQVVLEHMESLHYPHDGFVRGGLLSLSRLGVPRTW